MALTQIKTNGLADNAVTDAKVADAITVSGSQTGITSVGTLSSLTTSGDVNVTADGARFFVSSADYELISIGRAGSSGSALDQGYLRMKSAGSNKVAFHTAGDSYINGGSLGIGTDSPGYLTELRVNDTVSDTPRLVIRQLGTGDSSLAFQMPNSPYGWVMGADNSDSDRFKISTGVGDVGGTGEKMSIDPNGMVTFTNASARWNFYADSTTDIVQYFGGHDTDGDIRIAGSVACATTAGSNACDGELIFATASSNTNTERMRINSSGNVGINEDAPITKLDLRLDSGSDDLTADYAMYINNQTGAVSGRHATIGFGTYNNGGLTNVFGAVAEGVGAQSGFAFLTHNGGALTEKVRIKNDGSVGIGTTSPSEKLEVYDGDILVSSGRGVRANGGNEMIRFDSSDGVKINSGGSQRYLLTTEGEFLHTTARGGLIGSFRNDHSSIPYGIKIDFDNATPNNTNQYFITCQDSTNDKFVVHSNGDVDSRTNSYSGISDERLKENIVDATSKLKDLNKVRIVNYNFKDDADNKHLGVIAQELQKIFPKMINEVGEEKTLSVKYSIFVPMLIKAVQELSAKVEELEKN